MQRMLFISFGNFLLFAFDIIHSIIDLINKKIITVVLIYFIYIYIHANNNEK
jgi:hypothetical protein